jgi:hypothetical protein
LERVARQLAHVDKLPSAFADDIPELFSVILANVNLGVAIVAVQADRGIPYPAAGRGDLNDFFEHFFSCLLLNTPHPRVWCVAIEQERNGLSHRVYLSPKKALRKFNRIYERGKNLALWVLPCSIT